MSLFHPKRIKHLARHFGILGFLILLGYGYTPYSYYFLILLGPAFFLAYWLRTYGAAVTSYIPHEPLYNNLLILFTTLVYFGLLGFQLKSILNERGKIRLLLLLVLFGFLFYIHRMSFQELSLYWSESGKPIVSSAPSPSANVGPARDLTLGDNQT